MADLAAFDFDNNHFDQLVVSCIQDHPLLFTHRDLVLDHLLFTTGGGYEWYNGQITDIETIYDIRPDDDKQPNSPELLAVIRQAPMLGRYNGCYTLYHKWYPVSEYSLVNQLPPITEMDISHIVGTVEAVIKFGHIFDPNYEIYKHYEVHSASDWHRLSTEQRRAWAYKWLSNHTEHFYLFMQCRQFDNELLSNL